MTKSLLVTGANGDIGRQVVEQALAEGRLVIAAIRDDAQRSRFKPHARLQFVLMHVDNPVWVKESFVKIDEILAGSLLDGVIHCAAIELAGTVEFLKPEDLERILRVNAVGTLSIIQQSLPRLRLSRGNLVIASSLWGRVSGPMVGAYAASKWAIEAIADALRRENHNADFGVSLANIGAVKSKMLTLHVDATLDMLKNATPEEQALYGSLYRSHGDMTVKFTKIAISPAKVAASLLRISGKTKPKARYAIGTDAKALCFLNWFLPTWMIDVLLGRH